ncbi:MAG: GNAT family N-acetyltransferase [Candidatus Baltobacteraceae bacterium]
MAEPLIVRAGADEIAYFARRRLHDEHGRTLYLDLAQMTPDGVYVAKDEGTPVGIVVAHALEDEWYVCDLFVEPSFRKQGTGWNLLSEAAADAGDAARSGVLEPAELGGIALCLQRGAALQMPLLQISGPIPHENELARMAAGEYRFQAEPLDPTGYRAALAQLDRDIRGSARPFDHAYFSQKGRGFIFVRESEIAGYAYVWPSGRIGPLAASSQAYLVQLLAFALASVRQVFDAEWCTLLVPGTNSRLTRAAMRAGLKVDQVKIFASDGGAHDLSRYVAFHALLL